LDLNLLFTQWKIGREPLESRFSRYIIEKLDLHLLDIGSNHGEFSLASLPYSYSPCTLVDAQENLLRHASRELHRQGFTAVRELYGAVGYVTGSMLEFIVPLNHSGGAKVITDNMNNKEVTADTVKMSVPSLDIIKIIESSINSFMKVDIEGSERNLIEQLKKAPDILISVPVIALEASDSSQVITYFSSLSESYSCYYLEPLWCTGANIYRQARCILNSLLTPRFSLVKVDCPNKINRFLPISLLFFIRDDTLTRFPDLLSSKQVLKLGLRDLFLEDYTSKEFE
jgi:FkbM family methyltransferase